MEIKTSYIVLGIIAALFILFGISCISVNNTAIGYEQNIEQSVSNIQVQQQRQKSLIMQLVQVVERASDFESETQINIAKLRTAASSGNVEEAQFLIQAVSEAYPILQANQTYVSLMNEMAISENLVANYRGTYNTDVRNYNRYVQRFPARMFLSLMDYQVQDYPYLEFTDTELPDQLFK